LQKFAGNTLPLMNRSMTMSGTMKMRCRGQVGQAATAAPEGQRANFIRFDDGAAYERIMGAWSRLVGEIFLDWIAPRPGLRWVDVGCGNGAFTELLVERFAPAEVQGIDPSEGQLKYAQARPATRLAEFRQGDAMALPFPAHKFDAAVMALVIFFVPDPAKGVAEMVRVVSPGGTVAAYAWDMAGGGFPRQPIQTELLAMGFPPVRFPSFDASKMDNLQNLWRDAGLDNVETRKIEVQRTFADFDDFWATAMLGSTIGPTVAAMTSSDREQLKTRVRARLPANGTGHITYGAWANAVKGRVPDNE
jgi:ubiquinone/menaquinone biosynthesis C-methylase UbiE